MSRLIDADALIIDLMDAGLDQIQMKDYSEVIQVIERQTTVNPWHRVEEPPKDSKPVICWEKQGFPYVDRYFPKYGWEFANNALAEPICWMPIEPPKEKTMKGE